MNYLDLIIGTYGNHIYKYRFNTHTLEFTLLGKLSANNASYALEYKDKGVFGAIEKIGGAGKLRINFS